MQRLNHINQPGFCTILGFIYFSRRYRKTPVMISSGIIISSGSHIWVIPFILCLPYPYRTSDLSRSSNESHRNKSRLHLLIPKAFVHDTLVHICFSCNLSKFIWFLVTGLLPFAHFIHFAYSSGRSFNSFNASAQFNRTSA